MRHFRQDLLFVSRVFRLPSLCLLLALVLLLIGVAPRAAHADDTADTVFTAFTVAAGAAGLPFTKEELAFAKSLVSCAADGAPVLGCTKTAIVNTVLSNLPPEVSKYSGDFAGCLVDGGNVGKCAEKFALDQVLAQISPEAQPMVSCVIEGTPVKDCAAQAALAQVPDPAMKQLASCLIGGTPVVGCLGQTAADQAPEPVRPLAQCIAQGGNVTDCTAKFAASQVPEAQRPMAECVATSGDVKGCAAQFAIKAIGLDDATQKAAEDAAALAKTLKGEHGPIDTPATNTLRNIMMVAQGINDGDWGKILQGGGTVIAEAVVTAILYTIVTPALGEVIGPVVNVIIQNDVDLMVDLVKAIKNKDVAGIGALAFDFYATTFVAATCALIPAGAFREATCGNVAKAIVAVGKVIGGVIGFLGDAISWVATGVVDVVVAVADYAADKTKEVEDFDMAAFGLKRPPPPPPPKPDCGTQADYLANNYLACLSNGVEGLSTAVITNACVKNFSRCYKNAADICGAMATPYQDLVDKIGGGISNGADLFMSATSVAAFALAKGNAICKNDFWVDFSNELIGKCARGLTKNIPISNNNACPIQAGGKPQDAGATKAEQACAASLKKVDVDSITKAAAAMCSKLDDANLLLRPLQRNCRQAAADDQRGVPVHLGLGGPPFRPTFMNLVPLASSKTGFLEDQKDCTLIKRLGDDTLVTRIDPHLQALPTPDVLRGGARIIPLPVSFGQPGNTGNGGGGLFPRVNPNQPAFNGWIVPAIPAPTANTAPTGKGSGNTGGSGRPGIASLPPKTPPSNTGGTNPSRPDEAARPPRIKNPSGSSVTGTGGTGGGTNPIQQQVGPPRDKTPAGAGQAATGSGGTGGGTNKSKAMDTLGDANTAANIGGAGGAGSGGADIPRPRPGIGGPGPGVTPPLWGGPKPGPLGGPKQQAGGPKGGPSTAKGPDGGNVGGWNGTASQPDKTPIKPPPGGQTGTPKVLPTSPPKATKPPPVQGPVDIGGCAKCGQKPKDDLVVH